MKNRTLWIAIAISMVASTAGWTYWRLNTTGESMTAAATKYLATLSDEALARSQLDYDSDQRVGWHFIPKQHRKGLQIKEMNEGQRKAALALLQSCLSRVGYDKATKIMALESVLAALEKERTNGPLRDPQRYYYTIFGKPADNGRWGLSIEGHHLSLNFVVEDGKVVSSTPTFFAANPTIVGESTVKKVPPGTRVLAEEETLAFELVQSLTAEQQRAAIIADKAPREIRAAGEPQPPTAAPVGITLDQLNRDQKLILRDLVTAYANNLPPDLAQERIEEIKSAGIDKVYFAWAGAQQPGVGHYYRIQGPTFLIEFVNTQPDAAGNPASHIHCVWRDMRGDFAIPLAKK